MIELGVLMLAALGLALRTCLSLIFAAAGVSKLRDPAIFERAVAGYRLLPGVLVAPVAMVLPFLELAIVGALWIEPLRPAGAAAAVALLLLFATAMEINIRRGRTQIDCGCGSGFASQAISRLLVLRNGVLAGTAALVLAAPDGLGGLALANCLVAGLLLFGLHILVDLVLALIARPTRSTRSAWNIQ